MQIPRFTASKPSKFAFASDEKSIRQPTPSFVRRRLRLRLGIVVVRAVHLLPDFLRLAAGLAARGVGGARTVDRAQLGI